MKPVLKQGRSEVDLTQQWAFSELPWSKSPTYTGRHGKKDSDPAKHPDRTGIIMVSPEKTSKRIKKASQIYTAIFPWNFSVEEIVWYAWFCCFTLVLSNRKGMWQQMISAKWLLYVTAYWRRDLTLKNLQRSRKWCMSKWTKIENHGLQFAFETKFNLGYP